MACLMNGEIYIALFHSLTQYLNDRIRVKKKIWKRPKLHSANAINSQFQSLSVAGFPDRLALFQNQVNCLRRQHSKTSFTSFMMPCEITKWSFCSNNCMSFALLYLLQFFLINTFWVESPICGLCKKTLRLPLYAADSKAAHQIGTEPLIKQAILNTKLNRHSFYDASSQCFY